MTRIALAYCLPCVFGKSFIRMIVCAPGNCARERVYEKIFRSYMISICFDLKCAATQHPVHCDDTLFLLCSATHIHIYCVLSSHTKAFIFLLAAVLSSFLRWAAACRHTPPAHTNTHTHARLPTGNRSVNDSDVNYLAYVLICHKHI